MERLIHFARRIRYGKPHTSWAMLRYFPRWRKSRLPGASSLRDRQPWISFAAIDLLKRVVKPTDRVFEFGGGGSTLFWCDRAAEVVTVEHDTAWFAALQQEMARGARAKWTGMHHPAEPGNSVTLDPADPAHFASTDEPSQGKHYRRYVESIRAYPDEHFDIILIDGRARTSCLAVSTPKLKPGGLLILDNAERAHYTARNGPALKGLTPILQGIGPVPYGPDFSETRIYRKHA